MESVAQRIAARREVLEADEQSIYKKRMHRALRGWKKLFPVDTGGDFIEGTISFDSREAAEEWRRKVAAFLKRITPEGAVERFPRLMHYWTQLRDHFQKYMANQDLSYTSISGFEHDARTMARYFAWYRKELLETFLYQIEPDFGPEQVRYREAQSYLFGKKRVGPFILGMSAWEGDKIKEPSKATVKDYDELEYLLTRKIIPKLERSKLIRYFKGVTIRKVDTSTEAGSSRANTAHAEYDAGTSTVSFYWGPGEEALFHELGHHLVKLLRTGRVPSGSRAWKDWKSWWDARDKKFTRSDLARIQFRSDDGKYDIDEVIARSRLPRYLAVFLRSVFTGYYWALGSGAAQRYAVYVPEMPRKLETMVGSPIHSGLLTYYSYSSDAEGFCESFAKFMTGEIKGGSAAYMLRQMFPTIRQEAIDREVVLAARREVLEARRRREKVAAGIKYKELSKDLRRKMRVINKALKSTRELKKAWSGVSREEIAKRLGVGYKYADEVDDAVFEGLGPLLDAFNVWYEDLEAVAETFEPKKFPMPELPMGVLLDDDPSVLPEQRELYRLRNRWVNIFRGGYGTERIPETGKEETGLEWLWDRLADREKVYRDFLRGERDLDLGSYNLVNSTTVGMYVLDGLGNLYRFYDPDTARDTLNSLKEIILRYIELMNILASEEWIETFVGKRGPFGITYRYQKKDPFTSDESDKIKAAVSEVIRVLRRFKVKDRYVSGSLIFTRPNDPRIGDAAGRYFPQTGSVYVAWSGRGSASEQIASNAQTAIHELGHRVWYKLPAKAQKQWEGFFEALAEPLSSAVKSALEDLKDLYDEAVRDGKFKKKRKSWEAPFPMFRLFERDYPFEAAVIRLEHWRTEEDFKRVVDRYVRRGIARKFVTAYGNSTATEAFPEVFVGLLYPSTQKKEYYKPEPIVAEFFKYILGSMREDEEDDEKKRIVEEAERRVRARRRRRSRNPR